jgi:hypothetical protein
MMNRSRSQKKQLFNKSKYESFNEPEISQDNVSKLSISIANHIISKGGKAEVVVANKLVKNTGGFGFGEEDARKKYADVIVNMRGRKAAISFLKDADTAAQQEQLANKAGLKYYNCSNVSEFKNWIAENM